MAEGKQSMSDAILSVEHLSMKFGGLVAVNDLTFEARRGEITAEEYAARRVPGPRCDSDGSGTRPG